MIFEDRVSTYPNRYAMTDENGNMSHVLLERADEPVIPGTPLNAETFNEMAAAIKRDAAPGYGLGSGGERVEISSLADLDNITANGWYSVYIPTYVTESADFGGLNFSSAVIRVDSYGGNSSRQTMYPTNTAQTSIVRYMYVRASDQTIAWSPWYVDNPPMYLGVEYRTTERWDGLTVYAKAINLGGISSGVSSFAYQIAETGTLLEIVDYRCLCTNNGVTTALDIEPWAKVFFDVPKNALGLSVTIEATGYNYTGVAFVKYTKA